MRRFDYSFLRDNVIGSDMINRIVKMDGYALNSKVRMQEYPSIFTELEYEAKIKSVRGSNAIEGIVTTYDRIEAIVGKGEDPVDHTEGEIAGYRDALNYIHNEYRSNSLNEEFILRIYGMMMAYKGADVRYKDKNNVILEIDAQGNRSVRFVPIDAEDVPHAMEQLILAYYDARDSLRINPLLLIPCFILDFLSIHPFDDGNGRMSRLLSLFLMYDSGIDVGKYISFEDKIDSRKGEYYRALRRSSEKWHENKNDYRPFIEDFIDTLFLCYRDLDRRFVDTGGKKIFSGHRVEALVCGSLMPVSKKEIIQALPDLSVSTVESALGKLVREGKIVKVGANKNARYRKAGRV